MPKHPSDTPKRRPGRPRKNPGTSHENRDEPRKRPGRPGRSPVRSNENQDQQKRKPGRPRKNPVNEQTRQEKPVPPGYPCCPYDGIKLRRMYARGFRSPGDTQSGHSSQRTFEAIGWFCVACDFVMRDKKPWRRH